MLNIKTICTLLLSTIFLVTTSYGTHEHVPTRKIKYIVLDFGRVIGNVRPELDATLKIILDSSARKKAFTGKISLEQALEEMRKQVPPEEFPLVEIVWNSKLMACLTPSPFMKNVIIAANELGYPVYVFSGLCRECWKTLTEEWPHLKIIDPNLVILSSDVGALKPTPEMFDALFNRIRTTQKIDSTTTSENIAKACLYIDDTKECVDKGRDQGMQVIQWIYPKNVTDYQNIISQIAAYTPDIAKRIAELFDNQCTVTKTQCNIMQILQA